MREIKFRTFVKETGEMIYGRRACAVKMFTPNYSYLDHEVEVMQFTGLCDKNNIEIYEGDIIKQEYQAEYNARYHPESLGFEGSDTEEGYHLGEVKMYPSKGVCLKNPLRVVYDSDIREVSNQYKQVVSYRSEVLGNIYENPDLIREHHHSIL